jgi:two-component system, chemotaxis family, chemotaxis protein CheY
MKMLVVEDDSMSRKLMQRFLASHGQCDVAVNGREGVAAFNKALEAGQPYDLICMDVMMPEMDGHTALKRIREIEKRKGIWGIDSAKVIMTTALGDAASIVEAFNSQCEAYLIKPIHMDKLIERLTALGLIGPQSVRAK